MTVSIHAITTRPFCPPQDDVSAELLKRIPPLQEGDIVVVTSKIIAIEQGRCLKIGTTEEKDALIVRESDRYIPKSSSRYGITLSLKEHTLIASGGIDESNADGYCILWPQNSSAWAQLFHAKLRARDNVTNLGVVITDSHCVPLRQGVVGISIGFYGFKPAYDYRGKPDIFGRSLRVTQANIPDAVAAAAVGIMGEGSECTPVAIVRGYPRVTFVDEPTHHLLVVEPEVDIYAPLLKAFK